MDAPNCYRCEYRRDVPGDAHSSCHHPPFAKMLDNPMAQLISGLAGKRFGAVGPVPLVEEGQKPIKVVGNPYGIKKGWFNWPFNFDPGWLMECSGYTPKREGST